MTDEVPMTLDLSGGDALPLDVRPVYQTVLESVFDDYPGLVQSIPVKGAETIDWWVTALASRDPYQSNFFGDLCSLVLIKTLFAKGRHITRIVVRNRAMSQILSSGMVLPANTQVVIAGGDKRSPRFKAHALSYIAAMYHCLARWGAGKKARSVGKLQSLESFSLVETVVSESSITPGGYVERNYPGLLKHLSEDESASIFFMPMFYGVKKYRQLINALEQDDTQNFVYLEDFQSIADTIFAALHPWRLSRLKTNQVSYSGFDLTLLIRQELKQHQFHTTPIESLLKFRAASKIARQFKSLKLVIDWYEGQPVDRGLDAGFRQARPDLVVKGYQGFSKPKFNGAIFPPKWESDAKVCPSEIDVIGQYFVDIARARNCAVPTVIAPAFRFADVWNHAAKPSTQDEVSILIALPIFPEIASSILQRSLGCAHALAGGNIRWQLKIHPRTKLSDLVDGELETQICEIFDIVEQDMLTLLEATQLLITSASSAALESAALGVPVAVFESWRGPPDNPLPEAVNAELVVTWTEEEELVTIVRDAAKLSQGERNALIEMGKTVRGNSFHREDSDAVRKFLDLETDEL